MNRSRVVQMIVLLLLIAFVSVALLTWLTSKNSPKTIKAQSPKQKTAQVQEKPSSKSSELKVPAPPKITQPTLETREARFKRAQRETPEAPAVGPLGQPSFSRGRASDVRDPFNVSPMLVSEIRRRYEQTLVIEKPEEALPQAPEPSQLPNLQIQGVFWGIPKPQAIINRQIVTVGDVIERVEILSIGKEGVTVSFNDREVLLEVPDTITGSSSQRGRSGLPFRYD